MASNTLLGGLVAISQIDSLIETDAIDEAYSGWANLPVYKQFEESENSMEYYYRRGSKYFFRRGKHRLMVETNAEEIKNLKRGQLLIQGEFADGSKRTF